MPVDAIARTDEAASDPDQPAPELLRVAFPPTATGVRRVLGIVSARLRAFPVPETDLHTLELVLAEAMNNVVEHACIAPSDSEIELTINHLGRAIRCVISDTGLPMPNGTPPAGRLPPNDVPICDQSEGGFGWYLIRELSTDLVYVRSGARNELTFLVPLTGGA